MGIKDFLKDMTEGVICGVVAMFAITAALVVLMAVGKAAQVVLCAVAAALGYK